MFNVYSLQISNNRNGYIRTLSKNNFILFSLTGYAAMSIILTSYNVKGRCRDADGQVRRLYKDTFRKHLYFVFYNTVRYYEH